MNDSNLRALLVFQAALLAFLTFVSAVVAFATGLPPLGAVLGVLAVWIVGHSARTATLTKPLLWVERLLIATLALDTAIGIFTGAGWGTPVTWVARLLIPAGVLATARGRRSGRSAHPDLVGVGG